MGLDCYHLAIVPLSTNTNTDWAIIAGDAFFNDNTYDGNRGTPATVGASNGDRKYDIYDIDTIVDLLDDAGLDYKVYSEDYPTSGECNLGSSYGNLTDLDIANFKPDYEEEEDDGDDIDPIDRAYKRKHNPFISFKTFTDSPERCASQQDFDDLNDDLASGNLPAFSFVVPNQAHDGHDTTIAYSGTWFAAFIANVTASPAMDQSRVLVHATYDEDETAKTYYYNHPFDNTGQPNPYYDQACEDKVNAADDDATYYPSNYCAPEGCKDLLECTLNENDNKVYSILLGSALDPQLVGATDDTHYTHYSVLATLQANWGLDTLGRNDETAAVFHITGDMSDSTTGSSPFSGATSSTGTIWRTAWFCMAGMALVSFSLEYILQ